MLIDEHGPLRAYVRGWGLRDNQTESHYVLITEQAFRHSVGDDSVTSYAVLLIIHTRHRLLNRTRFQRAEPVTQQTIYCSSSNHSNANLPKTIYVGCDG
jgi:hypothetical protein